MAQISQRVLGGMASLALVLAPALLVALLWPYGLDVADSGWASVLTRDYTTDTAMAGHAAPWYSTWTIGAWLTSWDQGSPDALRKVGWVPIAVAGVAAWSAFFSLGHRHRTVALGICCAGLAAYADFSLYYLNYNTLSASLLVWSLALMILGRDEGAHGIRIRRLLHASAGFLFALGVTSRIASATAIVVVVLVMLVYNRKTPAAWVCWVAGAAFGGAFVVWCAYRHGHLDILWETIDGYFKKAVTGDSASHPRGQMIGGYLTRMVAALPMGGLLSSLILIASFRNRLGGRVVSYLVWLVLAVVVYVIQTNVCRALPLALVLLAAYRWLERTDGSETNWGKEQMLMLVGVIFAFSFPLGSMNGFRNVSFSLWILLPAVAVIVRGTRYESTLRVTYLVVAVSLAFCAYRKPFNDGAVSRLNVAVRGSLPSQVKTRKERAEALQPVVDAIRSRVDPGESIFVCQSSPMIYMLTGTRPWIPYPWPYIVSAESVTKAMESAESSGLPKVFARDKFSPFGGAWPTVIQAPVDGIDGSRNHQPVYERFLRQHGYKLVYENACYEVYALP